jgi:hypothetical protein
VEGGGRGRGSRRTNLSMLSNKIVVSLESTLNIFFLFPAIFNGLASPIKKLIIFPRPPEI